MIHEQQRPISKKLRHVGCESSRFQLLGGLETPIKEQWRAPKRNVARV
jgi:hypothetical protein